MAAHVEVALRGHKAQVEEPLVIDPLQRPFRALIFDWDGTAVRNQQEDATTIARLSESLLDLGVRLVVMANADFDNIDRQFCQLVAPQKRHHLLICADQGSEIYGFDCEGKAVRRWLHQSTAEEEHTLTAIVERVRDTLAARMGMEVRVISDRPNRRKIDLIPLPEWTDPSRAQIGALFAAVEQRLHGAGVTGGIDEVIRLTERLAHEHGLAARITSDVKHVEVGLTDKGDALDWIKREVLQPEDIALNDTLIAGHAFAPVAGFAGSDDRLRQGAEDALVVSVGEEPTGVPDGVLQQEGGPARFRELLADQIWRHQGEVPSADPAPKLIDGCGERIKAALAARADPGWQLQEFGYHPALEHEIESLFTVSNGFLGVRGSLDQPTRASRPRTFIGGVYSDGHDELHTPAMVSGPDWLRLQVYLDGEPLSIERGEILHHSRTLDMHRGVMISEWRHRDPRGHIVSLRTLRFASLANRTLAAQAAEIAVEQPCTVTLEAWAEPSVQHLVLERRAPDLTVWRVLPDGQRVAMASTATLQLDEHIVPDEISAQQPRRRWTWNAVPGEPAIFSRMVAVTRGEEGNDPGETALAALGEVRETGVCNMLEAHRQAWAERWAAADVVIRGDKETQRAMRVTLYHLISAANPDDDRVSVPARAFTGSGYLGHIFWDTDIFVLPFYVFTWPAAARSHLMYRYRGLAGARAKAGRLGYRGALYAWEAANHSGEDVTPQYAIAPDGRVAEIFCGTQEQHISADVAYGTWLYWQVTGDDGFLLEAGAEILLETARFWASRAALEADGQYHIRGVIGPDEYHETIDDNAYTNGMAQWNIERGIEVAHLLESRWPERWRELRERLGITPQELTQWAEVAPRIAVSRDPVTGVLEQFNGFFKLEPVNLAEYRQRTAPMDVLLGPERTKRSQVIKQADVIMLQALLWDRYPAETREANFRYYEPRSGHGSSLSPPIHALVAARLGKTALAEQYFRQAVAIDLDDTMGNAAGGVHVATLGGLWQAIVLGFAGLSLCPDGLRLDPHLPESWETLRFPIQWRGRMVRVDIQRKPLMITVSLECGEPLVFQVGEQRHELSAGQSWSWRWEERDGR